VRIREEVEQTFFQNKKERQATLRSKRTVSFQRYSHMKK
jgi:hypothetical protein